MEDLLVSATSPDSPFSAADVDNLNKIDSQLTEIMLTAKHL
jgi:hypothetical protein